MILKKGFAFVLTSIYCVVALEDTQKPIFRILAPQFICPKDEETVVDKPDETVIILQTAAGADLKTVWTVRWEPLPTPSQRFTLMLWRTVRKLEKLLNGKQKEKYVYVIDNSELLKGVNFIFSVSVRTPDVTADPQSFQIDNSQGEKILNLADGGRADLFSIIMLGGQVAYPDIEFILEAQVTMCVPTEDYYFNWKVRSIGSDHEVDVSQVSGSRLVIPPNHLKPGLRYDANCQVIKASNEQFLTQTGLDFHVARRSLEVYLSADHLVLSVKSPFTIEAMVLNHDHVDEQVSYQWSCSFKEEACEFESEGDDTLRIVSGLSDIGQYEFMVTVTVNDETASATMKVTVIDSHLLPIIQGSEASKNHPVPSDHQMTPMPRIQNEGSTVPLVANVSNVTPSCSLTWYFTTNPAGLSATEHGEVIADTLTVNSLEENFLTELADFTNETEWIQVTAEMSIKSGRARLVADCGCSLTFSCQTLGLVYADVHFVLNESPKAESVLTSPDSGAAMETVFRISTPAVVDPDTPLKYTFYCSLGGEKYLMLAFFIEHRSLETLLPYVDGGTEVWVEVCDAKGACNIGPPSRLLLEKGDGQSAAALVEGVLGNMRRCELMTLTRVAAAALVTYKNIENAEALSTFSASLTEMLSGRDAEICRSAKTRDYAATLQSLRGAGFDTESFV